MKKRLTILSLALSMGAFLYAQDEPVETIAEEPAPAPVYSATPKHMWEFGLHGGHAFIASDFDFTPGFGGGIHIRRALDYVFSIRADILYASMSGEASGNRTDGIEKYTNDFISGAVQGIITINNLRWNNKVRKVNMYALLGGGVGNMNVTLVRNGKEEDGLAKSDSPITPFIDGGVGIAFRASKRFNIGIEHKATFVIGRNADLMDGYDNPASSATTFRDIGNYTSLRLNFNLGNTERKAEPLYWVNPMDAVLSDISELKARPDFEMADQDKDGVIDLLDQEPDTPEGAPVDTRGIALDSDGDGVKDYMDKEPYSPPGYTVDDQGVSNAPEYVTEQRVSDIVDNKLKDFEMAGRGAERSTGSAPVAAAPATTPTASLAGWFLPIIHFNIDSYTIRESDYGLMSNVAYVLKENPNIKVAVTGYTDKTASEQYNRVLSYNRAKSAIEFLVNNHNIDRNRLILQYSGEEANLVPTASSNFMNRRVEFRIADKNTKEMERPSGPDAGKGRFSGSKDAGY